MIIKNSKCLLFTLLLFSQPFIKSAQMSPDEQLLDAAGPEGNFAKVKHMIDNGLADIDAQDNVGNTPLHLAIFYGSMPYRKKPYFEIIVYLLKAGANELIQNDNGKTAIDFVKQSDNSQIKNLFSHLELI